MIVVFFHVPPMQNIPEPLFLIGFRIFADFAVILLKLCSQFSKVSVSAFHLLLKSNKIVLHAHPKVWEYHIIM